MEKEKVLNSELEETKNASMETLEKLEAFDKEERTLDDVTELITVLLKNKEYKKAREVLLEFNAADIAEILTEALEDAGIEKLVIIFRTLPKDISVDVFAYMDIDEQLAIINAVTDKEIQFILDELDFDDMIDIMEEMPANLVDKILEKTPKDERKLINTFLNYPENCAGTLMTPYYISLQKDWTVAKSLEWIKQEGEEVESVYTCYVKDKGRKLIGVVTLSSLVLADDNEKVENLMDDTVVSVNVYDDQEEVSDAFKKYDFLILPVVDKEDRLVGIITVDDIIDVIEDEATEDFERMAGIVDNEDKEYLDTTVLHHVRTRLPWLILLTISAMITGAIISHFELLLSQAVCLVAYLPLLMGTGGNAGSQPATLIIRGMAVGELELNDAFRVAWKELRVSFIIGVILSVFNFAKIMLIDGESGAVALTVSLSIILIVLIAKIVGGLVPMAAKAVGIDPALMSTPFISSIIDMVSVITYFLMASAVMGI